ncbi:MAG: alanine/glycine:cation symporter family protein [Acidobacteriota bacterium]|nr:alanine/glycine:cation symporter family protein [Acidobacteriota bacterium]
MGIANRIDSILATAVEWAWGPPLLVLVLGGGLWLTVYVRFLPLLRLPHALRILRGDYDRSDDPGQISHLQALSTALASTIGIGNIGGVAIAITQGGPGAVFWMWAAALVGMATKFFTCTLAVMYRGRDSAGELQGGPMYYIEEGLGRQWRFMGVFFALCGLVGCLPMFQANQMAEILHQSYSVPPWVTGAVAVMTVAAVAWGGIVRIGEVASRLVPSMCLIYLFGCLWVVGANFAMIPEIFKQILHDAFNGTAATGAMAGIGFATVVRVGVRRAAFSNEAGVGTAPMAHGAAKTKEPVREGLVAMLGPFIDTIIVCSLTAFVILSSGLWMTQGVEGVSLTSRAFSSVMGSAGPIMLTFVVVLFGASTMVGYSYYGRKCFIYLFGAEHGRWYEFFYLGGIFVGALWSRQAAINLLDIMFVMMALPNMIATLLLSPRVVAETRRYFRRLEERA